jgi:hypothetical protein
MAEKLCRDSQEVIGKWVEMEKKGKTKVRIKWAHGFLPTAFQHITE